MAQLVAPLVSIHVKGLSEAFSRILKTYRICTAVRPHTTILRWEICWCTPKTESVTRKSQWWFIKIPCKNCERVYVGETGRPLGARVKERRKEVDSITGIFTRAEKTRAASICNKSAITDHVCNGNHVRDWQGRSDGGGGISVYIPSQNQSLKIILCTDCSRCRSI